MNIAVKSSKKHSKKRNVGLVYQFLVRYITEATLRNDAVAASKGTKILKEHFKFGTELYKEWRLFNAIIKTQGLSDATATAILRETRTAATKVDVKTLDVEKLRLIDIMNRGLGSNVFEQIIPTYKMYATVQTLFNDWRAQSPDVVRIVDYEGKLFEHLTSNIQNDVKHISTSSADDALIVRLMTEKFNNKYVSKLLPRQRMILSTYTSDGQTQELTNLLETVKKDALSIMSKCVAKLSDQYMIEKLKSASSIVENLNVKQNIDLGVTQCMKLCELINELSQFETC